MPSKPELTQFTQQWNKTVNWAQQNKIPYSAYYPVYQQEVQKFVTSGGMYSEGARISAIEAAAGLNYSTALPTDNPNPTDVLGNIKHNLQEIFTPSTPWNMAHSIFSTIWNTAFHPSTVYTPIEESLKPGSGGPWKYLHDTRNDIWNFMPGVSDIATLEQTGGPSMKGWDELAQSPVTSSLDIVPMGRAVSEGLGRTAIGETAAARLGMSTADFRKAGIWRVGGRLIKTVPVNEQILKALKTPMRVDAFLDPETGSLAPTGFEPMNIGQLWEHYKGKMGANYEQGEVTKETIMESQQGTREFTRLLQPEMEHIDKLDPTEYEQLVRLHMEPHTVSQVLENPDLTDNVKAAYEASQRVSDTYNQMILQSEELLNVQQPIKDENGQYIVEQYLGTSPKYKALISAQERSVTAQTSLNDAAKGARTLMFRMGQLDKRAFTYFQLLDEFRNTTWQAIQGYLTDQGTGSAVDSTLRKTLPTYRRIPSRAEIEQTPGLRSMLGLPPQISASAQRLFPDIEGVKLSQHHVNDLKDLFAPNGLLDQMVKAFQNQDWVELNRISKVVMRKFNNQSFRHIPKDGRATLYKTRQVAQLLQRYAVKRHDSTDRLQKLMLGHHRGEKMGKAGYQKSIAYLMKKAADAHQSWVQTAIRNPPDLWRNIAMEITSNKVAQAEKTAANIEDTTRVLSAQGWEDSTLTKLRADTRTIQELMSSSAKMSFANDILPDMDPAEWKAAETDMYNQLVSLRARGEKPLALSALTEQDVKDIRPNYDIYVGGVRARRPGITHERTWGYTPSIYDVRLGLLKTGRELMERDTISRFVDNSLLPRLYLGPDIERLAAFYFRDEIGEIADQIASGAPRTEAGIGVIERYLEDKFNLVAFKPEAVGLGKDFTHPTLGSHYYIDKDIAKAFNKSINRFQLPAQGVIDRGTKLFRFSILGLSPRYTAHIVLGGTYLVALRGHLSMLNPSFLRDAFYYGRHGSFNDRTLERFPWIEALGHSAGIEEGLADINYHYIAARDFTQRGLVTGWLNKHGMDDTWPNRFKAMGQLNMQLTRGVVRAQQALVYMDAAVRAERSGKMVTVETPQARMLPNGEQEKHAITGRPLYDFVQSEHPITKEEAHQEAMKAVASVMGEMRHMTPLEYGTFARLFPFYSWTKHIIKYVSSYPFDHPYRAMIISQIAKQQNAYWNTGLPLRMQLLLFLGQPDQYGNVTAIDAKSMNPLRDVANYATMVGILESLNPAIVAPFAMVDPQISFGGQSLFPQSTYNSLYGVETAGPGGNLWTAVEQFVPQTQAADAAFNLSGQYAYLRTQSPQAFSKKIFESLGLPLMPQEYNLRQIAAKGELDRFNQAKTAAENYVKGDTSALQGYAANESVPDPFNTMYDATPAYLAALNDNSYKRYNLPAWDTTIAPPSPPL